MKFLKLFLCVFIFVTAPAHPSLAKRIAATLGWDDLEVFQPADSMLGPYYVLQIAPPSGIVSGTPIEQAFLELYLDVESRWVTENRSNEAPMIEMYALNERCAGVLDPVAFRHSTVPSIRNVAVGQNRRVVFDVTEILVDVVSNPTENHGVIFGALTGVRDGVFLISADQGESVARLIVFTEEL
jgi:hypothetical protein